MANQSFIVVIDIPSIKGYVFGTDPLREVRGASARLDWLNRERMERCLRKHLDVVELIYANGGSAQFLVRECDETTVKTACTSMVRYIREQTGGEVQAVYGIALLEDEASYLQALREAHFQLRCRREFATCRRSASLMPTMMECQSASHLPAVHIDTSAGETRILSEVSYGKIKASRRGLVETNQRGLWAAWMQHLATEGPWPEEDQWDTLRCETVSDIGTRSSWRGYVGLVYADGNAMGQVVQRLKRPQTFRQFSRIVDEGIREACFTALSQVFQQEVDGIRGAHEQNGSLKSLAADILLLGGDDLLVAVPADRALDFALKVTDLFERLTQEKIAALPDEPTRQFFRERLDGQGFTVSCGVAIAKSSYPFYLLLDLAEQLLKNAKRKDGHVLQPEADGGARIDFHVVAGANSRALKRIREGTYRIDSDAPRTLRPLSRAQLEALRASAQKLRDVGFPRSKLHELQDAALAPGKGRADWHLRSIFVRCKHGKDRSERWALWQAIHKLRPAGYAFDFPWFTKDDQRLLCVADLVDAYDLFQR